MASIIFLSCLQWPVSMIFNLVHIIVQRQDQNKGRPKLPHTVKVTHVSLLVRLFCFVCLQYSTNNNLRQLFFFRHAKLRTDFYYICNCYYQIILICVGVSKLCGNFICFWFRSYNQIYGYFMYAAKNIKWKYIRD